jgi:hypothetical protein
MAPQVDRETFKKALTELGHDPNAYINKKLSLEGMAQLYEIDEEHILDAIDKRAIAAHYDYSNDTIWVDALDAAHFYFCIRNEAHLYSDR